MTGGGFSASEVGPATLCAWCDRATGELLIPGRRGAVVHASCEREHGSRRRFLFGALVGAATPILAPVLGLVPEAPLWTFRPEGGDMPCSGVTAETIDALLKERYRKAVPQLFERSDYLATRLIEGLPGDWTGPGPIKRRALRVPVKLLP